MTVIEPRMFKNVGRLKYRVILSFIRTQLHRNESTYQPAHLATAAVLGERVKTDTHTNTPHTHTSTNTPHTHTNHTHTSTKLNRKIL